MKVFFLSFALLFLGSVTAQAVTRYVKQTASGTGNGSSWANASSNLQNMINASTSGDEVWVAAGTYKPTLDPFGSASPTDPRDKTFFVKDGVKIYGGFAGTETTLSARNIATNVTTLSGDIGTVNDNTDNCYHVVIASALASGGVGVTVDGFAVTAGNANGSGNITVNGNNPQKNSGGGMYMLRGVNILTNNTLFSNTASSGGGIYNSTGTNTLTNNTLFSNTASSSGGAIYNSAGTNTLTNNTFSSNTANSSGGGISIFGGTNTLTNNTFFGNTVINGNGNGGGILTLTGTNTLVNNIFWGNKKGVFVNVQGADYYKNNATNTFKNNILQLESGNYTGANYALGTAANNMFATDPIFANTGDLDGADNIHRTADDGLRLQIGSPAINAGDPAITTPLTDITGTTRGAAPFDLGAYKGGISICTSANILYVNAAISASGNGTSFAQAFKTLDEALYIAHRCSAVTRINVATGTYQPTKKPYNNGVEIITTNGYDVTFHVRDGLGIYGGYDAVTGHRTEAPFGGLGATVLSSNYAYHIVFASAAASGGTGVTVDGFTIRGGNANVNTTFTVNGNTISRNYGGGIYTSYGTNILTNNTLLSNIANYGGGIYTSHGTNTVTNNILLGNTANTGGGIYIDYGTNTLSNNTLSGNTTTTGAGGGILITNGINTLSNNTLSGNTATGGGGISIHNSTNVLINNILSENTANDGGGIFIYNSTNLLTNNTLSGNTFSGNTGGGISIVYGTNTLTNNIFWGNKIGTDATVQGADYYNNNGTNTFNNNILQLASSNYIGFSYDLGTAANNIFATDPLFVNTADIDGADNIHRTADDGLRLQTGSPAIDAGDPAITTPLTDITGATRGAVPFDLGAYEGGVLLCTTPTAYTLTGGGAYCTGGAGVAVGLSNSETGVTYQLQLGGANDGAAVNGTGAAITFGIKTAVGTYTVVATRTVGACTANMTGSAVVSTNALPSIAITGATTGSVSISLTANIGVGGTYVWSSGSAPTAASNTFTAIGTYTVTVTATNANNCSSSTIVQITVTYPCPTATTLYVNDDATGANDGSSWADAYTSLSQALHIAHNCPAVTRVNVATGTYKPTKKPYNNGVEITTSNARDVTFHVRDGLGIYGGYDATTGLQATFGGSGVGGSILSGDIGTISVNTDNCYHVVLASAAVSGGVGVTVDGFTITGSNSDDSNISYMGINGNNITRSYGGGAYIQNGTNTLSNNTIANNTASSGGGINFVGGVNTFINNTVSDNTANSGGGISISDGITNLSNNTFLNNTAYYNGGGIETDGANCTIINNTLSGNTATYAGGGIYTKHGTITLTNNTFSNNITNTNGGGIYNNQGTNTFTNNIFWSNKKGTDATVQGADYYNHDSGNTFNNNILQLASSNYIGFSYDLGTAANNIFATDPLFVNAADPDGADNIHRTADDGLRLQAGSPTIDAGDPAITTPLTDITGATRGAVPFDLGAYEGGVLLCATPTAYTLTGGGAYCAGGTGVTVGLSNSETGVSYQLQLGGANDGAAVSGTGAAITFGTKTAIGTYTVLATRTVGACTANMTGSAVVSTNALPIAYTLTGAAALCDGDQSEIALSDSETGVSYQLQLGGVNNGAAVSGTGAAISFGMKTAAGTYSVVATHAVGGCTSAMSNTVVITHGANTIGNQSVTACDTYTWAENGMIYTTSGAYSHTTTNASGCTHTENLNLTIEFGVPNYTTETACDAYTWAINNTTYTASGTYVVTNYVGGVSNCPHDEVLVLTINSATSRITNETACDTYTWAENNMTYTASGTYSHATTNAWGCTHTEILNLTINTPTSSHTFANACTSYTWAINGTTYTTSGTYTYDTNVNGCTHTDYLHLHLNQVLYFSQTATACNSYTWQRNGQTYTQSGTYTYNDPNAGACGSVETLILTINNNTTTTTDISVCTAYHWAIDNNTYYTSGTYTYGTTTNLGCTHTEILNLTILDAPVTYSTETACDAYTWAINNTTYTTSGTYFVSNYVDGVSNCPHDEVLFLTINSATSHTVDETACDTYTWAENGMTYTASGTYSHVTTNAWGCTHTEILNLTINTPPVITTQPAPIVICTYKRGSATVVATGTGLTYQWQYSNNNGASVTGNAGDTGNNTATISNVPTTIVLLRCKITATNGCIAYSDWINVTTNPLPTLTIAGNTTGTGSVSLTADIGPGGTYVWSMGSTPNAASNTFTTVGTHSVTIIGTDINGCSAYNVADIRVIADCPTATTLYVNDDATGANNGTSWADAYTSLSQALHIAHTCPAITRINVAAGLYIPTKKPYNNGVEMTTSNARDVTFHVRNGLQIYGGYDTATNLQTGVEASVLSGDIGTADDYVDNAYHVLLVSSTSTSLGSGVRIDGFTVTKGNANGTGTLSINNNVFDKSNGGGIYTILGSNGILNNIITHNKATTYGGGVCGQRSFNSVLNSVIADNTTSIYGGGVYVSEGSSNFKHNVFTANTSSHVGGGLYVINGQNTIVNNTFLSNTASDNIGGGGLYTFFSAISSTNKMNNNIFWDNKRGGNTSVLGADYYNGNPNEFHNTFKNNMLQLASTDYNTNNNPLGSASAATGNIFAQNPNFIDATDPDGADNIYRTADDGLRLACGSPAINAGTNTAASVNDILNNPRLGAKDIGAYENQIDCLNNIYSDAAACKTFTIDNVSGNAWFHIYGTNGILASINPNGSDLGTVTAEVSDATDAIDFNNSKFLGRSINFTSSNYASSATIPNNYNLRIYYYDTELTEYNTATQGSFTTADLNMAWKEGGTGCNLTTYSGSNNGLIASADVIEADYGLPSSGGTSGNNGFYLDFALNHFTIFAATTASPTPLPVKWLKIVATPLSTNGKITDKVMVEWATASERNLSHYFVERGAMQNGNMVWTNIGRVTGKNSPTGAYYNFYDTNIQGLDGAYYRVISVDFDAATDASQVVLVNLKTDSEVIIYPNPTDNIITISVETYNRELPTELRDIHGKLIYHYKTVPYQIDLSTLPAAVYLLQIGGNVRRVVKQ
jgi:parallel beta-helix repeat protein